MESDAQIRFPELFTEEEVLLGAVIEKNNSQPAQRMRGNNTSSD
jgi:hypothetical protein